jgi:hypothetical protein
MVGSRPKSSRVRVSDTANNSDGDARFAALGGAEAVFDAVRFHDDGHASVKLIIKARAHCYLAKSVRSVDSKAIVRS